MRLVLAIVSITLAALMIGLGIAQRTILMGPDHVTAATVTTSPATVTVIDGTALNAFERGQTVMASGSDTIFAAYGRTSDVLAWVGDTTYNAVTFDPESQQLAATVVTGSETAVPDPAGSDLWLADFTQPRELEFTINVPEDVSVIIVADGTEPAPAEISVTWLLDNSTPFAAPLVIGGSVVLLLGLCFLLWAMNHVRRARGPRRKQQRLPKVPRKPTYKPVRRGAPQPAAASRGRRSARMTALPTVLVGAILLVGCTADRPGDLDNGVLAGSATADSTTDDVSTLETPAVTAPQAKRIVTRISEVIAEADASIDVELMATRMAGPALALRTTNYAVRKVVTTAAAPAAIPPSTVVLTLPQQRDTWPRTVFVVVQDETTPDLAPQALMLIQDDPRSQYKVHYAIALQPGAVIPDVAPSSIGASRLDSDLKIFVMPPIDVATAYGDILLNDNESEYAEFFEEEGDALRVKVGKADKDLRTSKIPNTARLSFANALGEGEVIAFATIDGGALVALQLNESETIKPIETGAAVNAPPEVAALLGKTLSTKGISATYGEQLLFFVPSATSGGKIVLLGYSQGLISAKEG